MVRNTISTGTKAHAKRSKTLMFVAGPLMFFFQIFLLFIPEIIPINFGWIL
jgi:hypothetical protein